MEEGKAEFAIAFKCPDCGATAIESMRESLQEAESRVEEIINANKLVWAFCPRCNRSHLHRPHEELPFIQMPETEEGKRVEGWDLRQPTAQ